jgi:hypothetical protein
MIYRERYANARRGALFISRREIRERELFGVAGRHIRECRESAALRAMQIRFYL